MPTKAQRLLRRLLACGGPSSSGQHQEEEQDSAHELSEHDRQSPDAARVPSPGTVEGRHTPYSHRGVHSQIEAPNLQSHSFTAHQDPFQRHVEQAEVGGSLARRSSGLVIAFKRKLHAQFGQPPSSPLSVHLGERSLKFLGSMKDLNLNCKDSDHSIASLVSKLPPNLITPWADLALSNSTPTSVCYSSGGCATAVTAAAAATAPASPPLFSRLRKVGSAELSSPSGGGGNSPGSMRSARRASAFAAAPSVYITTAGSLSSPRPSSSASASSSHRMMTRASAEPRVAAAAAVAPAGNSRNSPGSPPNRPSPPGNSTPVPLRAAFTAGGSGGAAYNPHPPQHHLHGAGDASASILPSSSGLPFVPHSGAPCACGCNSACSGTGHGQAHQQHEQQDEFLMPSHPASHGSAVGTGASSCSSWDGCAEARSTPTLGSSRSSGSSNSGGTIPTAASLPTLLATACTNNANHCVARRAVHRVHKSVSTSSSPIVRHSQSMETWHEHHDEMEQEGDDDSERATTASLHISGPKVSQQAGGCATYPSSLPCPSSSSAATAPAGPHYSRLASASAMASIPAASSISAGQLVLEGAGAHGGQLQQQCMGAGGPSCGARGPSPPSPSPRGQAANTSVPHSPSSPQQSVCPVGDGGFPDPPQPLKPNPDLAKRISDSLAMQGWARMEPQAVAMVEAAVAGADD